MDGGIDRGIDKGIDWRVSQVGQRDGQIKGWGDGSEVE
jgi:hypothetical protein